MVVVSGNDNQGSLTLILDESLSASFGSGLIRSGYHLLSLNDVEIETLISTQNIDAILLAASKQSRQFAENLPIEQRQELLLLLVPLDLESPIDPYIMNLVDAVLPAHPQYLEQQLGTLLELHQANHALRKKSRLLEQELAEQRRINNEIEVLKNAIVRNVSHELRTPLLQVKSAISLIADEVQNKQLMLYAENATSRLEMLVKNITMLGHSLDINIGPIIFRDAVDAAKRNLARIWTRRSDAERVEIEIEPNLPPVLADKQGLGTVLQLLMDNAIKFSEAPIQVIARRENDKIYVAVKDAGIGIAKDKYQDIFNSFFQVDSSSTRRYGGTGVGLALVKLILDHHNVRIHVESEENVGSLFWFYLPYVEIEDAFSSED